MNDAAAVTPDSAPGRRLSFAFAKRHGVLVNRVVDGVAECTYRDTASPQAIAEVRRYLRRSLRLERVPDARFDELLRQAYEAGSDAMQAVEVRTLRERRALPEQEGQDEQPARPDRDRGQVDEFQEDRHRAGSCGRRLDQASHSPTPR